DRCPDRIREGAIGSLPRAVIDRDGAVDRIGLEVWGALAALGAFAELRDLACRDGDVWARHEHHRGRGSSIRRQARQSDTDRDVVTLRGMCRTDDLAYGLIDPRLTFPRHRERPGFAT